MLDVANRARDEDQYQGQQNQALLVQRRIEKGLHPRNFRTPPLASAQFFGACLRTLPYRLASSDESPGRA